MLIENNFITLQKINKQYWLVEAKTEANKTVTVRQIKFLPEGVNGYIKIGKELAQELGLPFVKRNETPEQLTLKRQKRDRKSLDREKILQYRNQVLKSTWQKWLAHFENEQVAIIEGINRAEILFRNLSAEITKLNREFYYYVSLQYD
jgi:hypothetical protein